MARPSDAKRFQGYVAHADVAWTIKGDQKTKKIDLVFFKYAQTPGVQIENGALFVDFRDTDKHQYLVFLWKGAGESFTRNPWSQVADSGFGCRAFFTGKSLDLVVPIT